jgi:LPS sulfotransferase NodH
LHFTPPSLGVTPPTPFVILATPRSGSTWLADTLDAHPAIASYGELFISRANHKLYKDSDYEFFYSYYSERSKRWEPITRAYWSIRYLNAFYASRPGLEAIGCKLTYGQFRARPWLVAYLVLRRIRVVHLVRENLLDVILSLESAEARHEYHALRPDKVQDISVTLDPERLLARLRALNRQIVIGRRFLRLLPVPVLETTYEALVGSSSAVDSIVSFLGVREHVPLSSRFKKMNTASRRTLLANYDEVERSLDGTPFESFLQE